MLVGYDFMAHSTQFRLFHTFKVIIITYYEGWTVIQPDHPDPAGFPLTGEIRLRPDSMWHGGSDFYKLQYPVLH